MKEFKVVKVEEFKVRKGMKEGWIEMVIKIDGKEKKLIGREVREFWSEREEKKESWVE